MFTSTKIKQLNWKQVCLDRFKISSFTFFCFSSLRNRNRVFFDLSNFFASALSSILFCGLSIAYFQANKSFNPPYLFVILSFLLVASLGISISTRSKPQEIKSHFSNYYKPGALVEIKIIEELKWNKFYQNYTGQILSVDTMKTKGKVMIRISRKDSTCKLGLDEKLLTSENLTRFKPPLNPGEFDFKEYAERKGVYFQITLEEGAFLRGKNEQWNLRSEALMLREQVIKSLRKQDFSTEEFMVIEALLLGKKQDLSKEITDSYKNAKMREPCIFLPSQAYI